jgi:8-hydroxy-5-deazaflavin:NADPH oxidoreductase
MKISILGTGIVGRTLAEKLLALGHDVTMGTRNVAEKLASQAKDHYGNPSFSEWYSQNQKIKLGTFAEAAAFGEILMNATEGVRSIDALRLAGAINLNGKVLIDLANPLDFSKGMPPALLPELSNTNSLAEEIQKSFPDLKVVKALNTMWCGLMVNPGMIANGDHTVFICGDDMEGKEAVKQLLMEFGWEAESIFDLGDISAARGTEGVLPIWLRIFGATKSGAFNFKVIR